MKTSKALLVILLAIVLGAIIGSVGTVMLMSDSKPVQAQDGSSIFESARKSVSKAVTVITPEKESPPPKPRRVLELVVNEPFKAEYSPESELTKTFLKSPIDALPLIEALFKRAEAAGLHVNGKRFSCAPSNFESLNVSLEDDPTEPIKLKTGHSYAYGEQHPDETSAGPYYTQSDSETITIQYDGDVQGYMLLVNNSDQPEERDLEKVKAYTARRLRSFERYVEFFEARK